MFGMRAVQGVNTAHGIQSNSQNASYVPAAMRRWPTIGQRKHAGRRLACKAASSGEVNPFAALSLCLPAAARLPTAAT